MPSESFSVAMAFSLSWKRKVFSSRTIFSILSFFAASRVSLRSTRSLEELSSESSSGLMVRKSQPASERI